MIQSMPPRKPTIRHTASMEFYNGTKLLPRMFNPTDNWMSSRCLTSVVSRELQVFFVKMYLKRSDAQARQHEAVVPPVVHQVDVLLELPVAVILLDKVPEHLDHPRVAPVSQVKQDRPLLVDLGNVQIFRVVQNVLEKVVLT